VRFELFERLNKGGVLLTPQEVRACIYRGPFSELLRDLASIPSFTRLVKLQRKKQDDGTREELVLKFFAYLEDRREFTGAVTEFLNNYMNAAAQKTPHEIESLQELFERTVNKLYKITGGAVLRSGYNVTPINQLEAILVAVGELLREEKRIRRPPADWLDDEELIRYSTKGTNTRRYLNGRIERAKALLAGRKMVVSPPVAHRIDS
jgi:hypothetical protein